MVIPFVHDSTELKKLRWDTGIRIPFRQFERIEKMHRVGDCSIMLSIRTYEVRELVRSTRYTKSGLRLYILSRADVGSRWYVEAEMTTWDDTFEEIEVVHYGAVPTMAEVAAKDEWEKLCYRPGNAAVPLDNYDRVIDGAPTDPARMKKHYRPDNWSVTA